MRKIYKEERKREKATETEEKKERKKDHNSVSVGVYK